MQYERLQAIRANGVQVDSETISDSGSEPVSDSGSDTSSSESQSFADVDAYEPDNNMKATRSIQRKVGLVLWK